MAQSDRQQINIKGTREGLLVTLGNDSYPELIQELTAELTQKQAFLQGSRVIIEAGERPFTLTQLSELQEQFVHHQLELWAVLSDQTETRDAARELGLATRISGSQTDLDGKAIPVTNNTRTEAQAIEEAQPQPGGLLLKETVRSGQSIYNEGHVAIIGDVNPGAEIIAGGDVVVWGRLRGLVHAGALGDDTAVICALALTPTQLRIADQIAIPPDDNSKLSPEKAIIRDGQIIALPWQPRN